MRCTFATIILIALFVCTEAALRGGSLQASDQAPEKPPGYRSAWDDCHGVGASANERMRTLAAKIKGWAMPQPPQRNAIFDCQEGGQIPHQPTVMGSAEAGIRHAEETLAKYPVQA